MDIRKAAEEKRSDKNAYEAVPINEPKNQAISLTSRKRHSNPGTIYPFIEETPLSENRTKTSKMGSLLDKRRPNFLINALYYFCNFCESTSIHGFKFLGERHRYFIEKIWWFCVVCFAISGSSILIYKAYDKWNRAPVLVSFATRETPIWKIPFPAVTICPQTKANRNFFNFTEVYLKLRNNQTIVDDDKDYYNLFSLVCEGGTEYINQNETEKISKDDMMGLVLSFNGIEAANCKWLGESLDCDDMLSYTLTNEGWCVTFNMLDHDEVLVDSLEFIENKKQQSIKADKWSLENGYPSDDMHAFPRRTMLAGTKAGFQLDLQTQDDELDYLCSDLQGFKVALHHPTEMPNMDQYFLVPLNYAVLANVKPRMITTTDDLRQYSVKDRECVFPGENQLAKFWSYTQNNCMTECLRNYTRIICGCIGFDMPSDQDDEFCGAGNKECLQQVKVRLLELEHAMKQELFHDEDNVFGLCNCLPSCTSIDYNVETTQTDWKWRKTYQLRNVSFASKDFNWTKDHLSRLVVYYGDLQFLTSERHELTGVVDFLASCGGLLGLFCGFSVTSSLEILYYLTLRFVCNLKKFGRRMWSGDQELIEANANSDKLNG